MEISEQFFNDAIVINLSGTVDHTVGPVFERAIRRSHALDNRHVIVNLTDVTCIDGAGLGMFGFGLHTLYQIGIHRSVVNPPAQLREFLADRDMIDLAPIYHSELEARAVT